MRKSLLFIVPVLFLAVSVKAQLVEVNYGVQTRYITSYENYVGPFSTNGDCWEGGTEDYTGYIFSRDDINTGEVSTNCQTCDNDGDCTYAVNINLQTRTNLAYTIVSRIDAWEDDGGDRCTHDGGDDCRRQETQSINFREAASPSNSVYSNGPDWGGYDNHRWSIRYTWKYTGSLSAISPTCPGSNAAYTPGMRSWSANLTAGRTYYFASCGLSSENTVLRIYGSDGYSVVAFNDDACGSQSAITYTPTSTGIYYVELSRASRQALISNGSLFYEDRTPFSSAGSISGTTTICAGSTATLSSSTLATGPAGTITYQWQTSPNNITFTDIPSANGASYTTPSLSNTTYYRRKAISCKGEEVISNVVTITVNSVSVGGSTSVGSPTACINTNVSVSVSGQNGSVQYWEGRFNGGAWTNLGNAGATTITPLVGSVGIYDYRVYIQNAPCAGQYSSTSTVTVIAASVGGSASPALSSVCLGGNTNVSLSGNVGAIVRWEQQINGGGFVDIGQGGLSNIPTGVMNTAGNWEYRVVVQNSPCGTVTSSVASISVNAPSVGGTAASTATSLCNGANPTISITGNIGAVVYWEQQLNGGGFNNIGNAGSTSFSAGVLATGIYDYRAVIQNSPCATATSASVSITVSSPSVGGTAIPTISQLCAGGSTNITLSGNTGSILNWEQQVSGGGWVNIGNAGVSIIGSGSLVAGNNEFRAVIQNGGCSPTTSIPAAVMVNPTSVGGAVASNFSSVCDGSTITLTLSGQTGSITQWERQFNGGGWNSLANAGVNPLTTAALTPFGTYEFRALVQSGVCSSVYSSSVSVNVTQNDNPSFSYPSSVYCQGTTNPSPTIALGGGAFSAAPAGLAINTSNGIIDLAASAPGTYTVTHTTSGTCSSSATQIITVTSSQNASFNYGSLSYCLNAVTNPIPTVTSPSGTFTTLNPGLIFSNASTGEVNLALSQPGSYFVQYSLGGSCPSSTVQTVILNAVGISTFTYPANNYCQGGANPVPTISEFGGIFSATPSGLVFSNNQTGEVNLGLSAPNTYTITYNSGGLCPTASANALTVNAANNPVLSYSTSSFCSNGTDPAAMVSPAGGTFAISPLGLSIDASGTIDLAASVAGAYTVSYTAPGLCGTTASTNVIVVSAPQASIQPVSNLCTGSGTTALTASPSGGTWSGGAYISAGGLFNPAVSGPGSFPVNYLVSGSGGCNASATYNVVVNVSPSVAITTIPQLCSNDTSYVLTATPNGGTWSGNPFVSVSGLFYPLFAGQGTHPIIYTVNSGGCSSSASVNITVLNTPTPIINLTGTICTSGGAIGLSSNINGGIWSGGAYISASGTFTPSMASVGNNTVTYTITSGACTAQTTTQIAVSGGPNVNLLTPTPFCVNDASAFILANIPGGVFTGGSHISGTGLFSPANAVVGNNVVIYSVVGNNGCVGADTVLVAVNPNPDATITYPGVICEGEPTFTLGTATAGGVWSGGAYINSGVFDPAVAGFGPHNVTYTVTTGGCSSNSSISITVDPKPVAIFNSQPNGLTVYFTDLSPNADTWSWNFGDGSAEIIDQNPIHHFPDNGTYQVRLIVFNECGSDTIVRALMVNKALGVDDHSISGNIQVFPNPAADYIQLTAQQLGQAEWSMKVLDMSGKIIIQDRLYPISGELNNTIDIYTLKPGVYFIQMSDGGNKHASLKFIKL